MLARFSNTDHGLRSQAEVIAGARAGLDAAEAAGDTVTTDLLTQRIAVREKTAWTLRSLGA